MLSGIFVWLMLYVGVHSLTDEEISTFNTKAASACGSSASLTVSGSDVILVTNDVMNHKWGCSNRNTPEDQGDSSYTFPSSPTYEETTYCLSSASLGWSTSGAPFFGPLTSSSVNAVEGSSAEDFDCCGGHADGKGRYHYHTLPTSNGCDNPVYDSTSTSEPQLVGIAKDGYPIYGAWDTLDTSALDECHGMSMTAFGDTYSDYAYIAVADHFPYIFGCFRAEPRGNKEQTCDGMSMGEYCSCTLGILTEDGVTSKRHVVAKENRRDRLRMMIVGSARRDQRSSNPKFSHLVKRETLSDCFESSCGTKEMTDGVCTAKNL